MASENKKRKANNSPAIYGFSLKEKFMRFKRLLFYNSAQRQQNKKIDDNLN